VKLLTEKQTEKRGVKHNLLGGQTTLSIKQTDRQTDSKQLDRKIKTRISFQ